MTKEEIISKFNLYVDNSTELSVAEESDLFEKIVKKIAMDRPWEALKTQASGSILFDGTNYYITLPTDFAFFTENNQSTDNASPKVIFVGSNYSPYQIINFSDRRQYRNSDGYAYLDLANSKIVFTGNPSGNGSTYEFDYCKVPADSGLTDTPSFPPARFHDLIAHLMAVEENIIEQFPKAQSYAPENQTQADKIFKDLCYWNSQLRCE